MLLFRVFKKSQYNSYFNYKDLRFLSIQKASKINVEPIRRRYLKPLSTKKLEPWGGSNLNNIFAGTIDKRVLTYPSVLSNEEVDIVINHSAAVEDFFSKNRDKKITNDTLQKFRELELFGLTTPQKFGGAGYSETETIFLLECTGQNPNLARFLGYTENFGCRIINRYGNEEQKNKYLQALAEGRLFMTMAYLENGPLVDLSKIECQVIVDKENKQFILKGEKKWVHYADKADIFLVMARLTSVTNKFEVHQKFNIFIVENDLPGVVVHKLKAPWAEEANLYEISFKDVRIPFSNALGGFDVNGFQVLKFGLSHSNLTDATFCLSLMKKMFHHALQHIEENNLKDIKIRGHLYVKENVAIFLTYLYALESVIYLLTGSCDTCENPDLFNDAILAKALGIDFLQNTLKIYTEILGYESFKKSEIMEEALKSFQHYSVFDENIEYFKLLSGADAMASAGNKLAHIIKVFRNQFNNPFESLKLRFTEKSRDREFKSDLKIKMELHSSLEAAADTVENNILIIRKIAEKLFYEHGNLILHNEHLISELIEMTSYVFASIACLSRASDSICYDLNNHTEEYFLTQAFIKNVDLKIQSLYENQLKNSHIPEFYRTIGKVTFNYKEYPLEHPLSRAF